MSGDRDARHAQRMARKKEVVDAAIARATEKRGVLLVQSPPCGAARWVSDAPLAVHCERDATRRYWHHRVPEASLLPQP